ncbi:hypothetical protein GCM10020331_088110 [Ectobacillus funiculus]
MERILRIIFLWQWIINRKNAAYDQEAHHQLAREVARESMVLLKKMKLIFFRSKKAGTVAVIGEFAKKPRYQGGGSSHIKPTKLENILEEIQKTVGSSTNVLYADGYSLTSDAIDAALLEEAKRAAAAAGTVILFVGLPDRYESEGYDRQHLRMPDNHLALLNAVAEVNEKYCCCSKQWFTN